MLVLGFLGMVEADLQDYPANCRLQSLTSGDLEPFAKSPTHSFGHPFCPRVSFTCLTAKLEQQQQQQKADSLWAWWSSTKIH